ncbi:MAG: hypothetical protein L0H64_11940 [Pseudonocardia sp.]|nr:hypothetical protein [Pseudonocardia sp.]
MRVMLASQGEWAISGSLAHPALVAEADFVAVQQIRAARVTDDSEIRRYLLAELSRRQLVAAVALLRSQTMVI